MQSSKSASKAKIERVNGSNKNRVEKSKPVRRRAPAACQSCRARKVRCDVSECGSPCMNCRADDLECIVTIGKTRVTYADSKVESYLGGFIAGPIRQNAPPDVKRDGDDQIDSWRQSVANVQDQIKAVESNPFHSFNAVATDMANMMNSFMPAQAKPLPAPAPLYQDDPLQLPGWVKNPSSRIDVDDFEYLQTRGALVIPDQPLRDECFACFMEWVYPYSPIVDLNDIARAISSKDGSGGHVSLPVFQAIMFAGIGFVEMSSLHLAGFQSRKEAKKAFFKKVKLLYDFGYDTGQISIVQTLILMSYWVESSDSQKDIWHWIGVAIGTASKMGLNKDPSCLELSTREMALRRRVWWSLLMRDRLTALALRRNIQIPLEDCDVHQMTVGDFCIEGLSANIACPAQSSFLRDASRQHQIAVWCIEQAKLCAILGNILQERYSTVCIDRGTSRESQNNTKTTMALMPKKDSPNGPRLAPYDLELKQWAAELPSFVAYTNSEHLDRTQGSYNSFLLHRATLTMLYSTAALLFYRPLVSMNPPRVVTEFFDTRALPDHVTGETVIQEIRTAAFRITEIAGEVSTAGLVRFMQPIGVTVVSSAAVVHLAAIYSPFTMIHAEALAKLSTCLSVVEQLQETYIAADLARHVLYTGLKSAGVPLPANVDSTSITTSLQQSGFDPAQVAKSSFGNLFELLNASAEQMPQSMSSLAESQIIKYMDPTLTEKNQPFGYQGNFLNATAGV